jgi:hypothetical protein
MSFCSLTYDSTVGNEILYITDSGHDNGSIGGQSWAIYQTSANNVEGTLYMNEGGAYGVDNFDWSSPITDHNFLPDHFSIDNVLHDNNGDDYQGWINFRIWTSPAYTNTRNCYVNTTIEEEPPAQGTTSWSVASTSQEQGLNSIALGIAIIIVIISIALTAFIWNLLYKKPWL